jgi:hypothetical protein
MGRVSGLRLFFRITIQYQHTILCFQRILTNLGILWCSKYKIFKTMKFFFFFLALFSAFSTLSAQSYELRDWNRRVTTRVSNQRPSVGLRFNNASQVRYSGANRAEGWIFAVNVNNNREGIVSRGCSVPNCTPVVQRVVAGTGKHLLQMNADEILALADQQAAGQLSTQKQNTDILKANQTINTRQIQQVKTKDINLQKTQQIKN